VTIAMRPSCERETRELKPLICPTRRAWSLRRNNTTGNLRGTDMCELPVVPDFATARARRSQHARRPPVTSITFSDERAPFFAATTVRKRRRSVAWQGITIMTDANQELLSTCNCAGQFGSRRMS
jgi:hypothetical protein